MLLRMPACVPSYQLSVYASSQRPRSSEGTHRTCVLRRHIVYSQMFHSALDIISYPPTHFKLEGHDFVIALLEHVPCGFVGTGGVGGDEETGPKLWSDAVGGFGLVEVGQRFEDGGFDLLGPAFTGGRVEVVPAAGAVDEDDGFVGTFFGEFVV